MRHVLSLSAVLLALAACGDARNTKAASATGAKALPTVVAGAAGAATSAPTPVPEERVEPTRDGVGSFTSSPWTFSTTSYWIEGPTGLVLIDAQFTPSQAEKFVNAAEAATHKKAALAIVLHPNPDKFNGTSVFQKRGIKVITSKQVKVKIPGVFKQRTEAFASRYAPDWPTEEPAPESFGDADTTVEAGGVKVRLHVVGAGCSEAHVVAEWEGHIFPGDLVAKGNHSWLELGKPHEWLDRIKEMEALKPKVVHTGRSGTGGPELLTAETKYLRDVMKAVSEEKPKMPIPDGALARVAKRIEDQYPSYGYAVFLNIGLPAEWERQAANRVPEQKIGK